jgi:hypothetical protein
MAKKALMQAIKNITNSYERAKNEWGNEFLFNLKNKFAANGFRSDLKLLYKKATTSDFEVHVKYDKYLGYPTEKDLIGIVSKNFPGHEINWQLISVDDTSNVVTLMLSPSQETILIENVDTIPSEFISCGSCVYKRASQNNTNIFEIWNLKTADDGSLLLIRNKSDFEILSTKDLLAFKKGDVIDTPYGLGIFQKYDEVGNGFVQVGNRTHLIAKDEMKPYDQEQEKTKLYDYYAQLYGAEFAEELIKDYTTEKK